jgi:hypothetical protein
VFVHKPHPNIVDQLSGRQVSAVALTKEELQERLKAQKLIEEEEGEEGGGVSDVEEELGEGEELENNGDGGEQLDIPSDMQIPTIAVPLATTS